MGKAKSNFLQIRQEYNYEKLLIMHQNKEK